MRQQKTSTALGDLRSSRSLSEEIGAPEALARSFFRRMRSDGKSQATINRYELVIRQYLGAASTAGYPWPPTREHVSDYLAGQRDEGKAKNTVRNSHVALRSWFNWLLEEGEVSENPMLRLKTPSLDNVSPDPYSDDEVRAMLAACRGRSWLEARDAAIVAVLADTGLRASEFCGLTLDDVELDAERIRIVGKGGRQRYIGIGAAAQVHLDRYTRKRPARSPALWLGRTGRPITVYGLYQIIERIASAANIERKGIHRFRHYAATSMIGSGMGELDLARFMGWSTLAMAQRYTRHEAQERAIKAHRQHSPLDRL